MYGVRCFRRDFVFVVEIVGFVRVNVVGEFIYILFIVVDFLFANKCEIVVRVDLTLGFFHIFTGEIMLQN